MAEQGAKGTISAEQACRMKFSAGQEDGTMFLVEQVCTAMSSAEQEGRSMFSVDQDGMAMIILPKVQS